MKAIHLRLCVRALAVANALFNTHVDGRAASEGMNDPYAGCCEGGVVHGAGPVTPRGKCDDFPGAQGSRVLKVRLGGDVIAHLGG